MSTTSVKSTQIVAGVAVVLALLGGAYAVGRSHGDNVQPVESMAAPMNEPTAAAPLAQPVPERAPVPVRQPERVAAATPQSYEPRPVVRERVPVVAACESCARVTDVHTETRRGDTSGVGAVGGAVVGGLLGNMVGGGNGRKLATVAGAVGGGYAGNEIEKNRKSYNVWVIQVQDRDGRTRRFERNSDPGVQVGDEVRLTDHGFVRS